MWCHQIVIGLTAISAAMAGACSGQALAASESVLYSFQGTTSDGLNPSSLLTKVGGVFYGTGRNTRSCGRDASCGSVFKFRLGSAATIVHQFTHATGWDPDSPLLDFDGALYGTAGYGGTGTCTNPYQGCGVLYSLQVPHRYSVVLNYPAALGYARDGVIAAGNVLYGVADANYTTTVGAVYAMTPDGSYTVLHQFADGNGDGYAPQAAPTIVNGVIYGTTAEGGANGLGAIYKIGPDGTETILHSFAGSDNQDGAYPAGRLLSFGGDLYGTTSGLCTSPGGCGTIFKISPAGAYSILHVFRAKVDGYAPNRDLAVLNNRIYGTAQHDKYSGNGEIFSINGNGAFKVDYVFGTNPSDGAWPMAGLTPFKGALYGTTAYGGSSGIGTIFVFKP